MVSFAVYWPLVALSHTSFVMLILASENREACVVSSRSCMESGRLYAMVKNNLQVLSSPSSLEPGAIWNLQVCLSYGKDSNQPWALRPCETVSAIASWGKRGATKQRNSHNKTCLRENHVPYQLMSVFVHSDINIDPTTYPSMPKEWQRALAGARTQTPRSGASAGARRLDFALQACYASSDGFLPPSINNDAKQYSSMPNDSKRKLSLGLEPRTSSAWRSDDHNVVKDAW
jgi:hypothetical protein